MLIRSAARRLPVAFAALDLLTQLGAARGNDRAIAAATLGVRPGRWPRGASNALLTVCRSDRDATARAAALGALVRRGGPRACVTAWLVCAHDDDASVRRRAAELAANPRSGADGEALLALLDDGDALVAEAAAFALGERADTRTVGALSAAAIDHRDALVREAAVAALGAIGDGGGLPAILTACHDKPAIRRRAVLALAAFEGREVDAALQQALADPDWQVRQAAEDLTQQS